METRKRYYEDCHTKEFTARVLSCRETGERFAVTLDATAFYPVGGGQAADTGVLGDARVLDCREENGEILHICDRPLEVGAFVTGKIDWEPRFIRMQQHTGEHILSGILFSRYGCHNSGFHMNLARMQVDFDKPIPQENLEKIEAAANEAIWRNLPVLCSVPDPDTLASLSYRTKRALPWPVRIVEIPGIDRCACCGVHAASTGEVGILKIYSMVPFREGVRIEMACGKAAYTYLNQIYRENQQVSRLLSVPVTGTAQGAASLLDRLEGEKNRAVSLERELLNRIAEEAAGKGNAVIFRENLSPDGIRLLADALASSCGGTAAVLSGSGETWRWCLAARQGDLKPLEDGMKKALNARGGGKPNFRQGSLRAEREKIESFFLSQGFAKQG